METGKITITFKDDDTHDLEIENIDGMELLEAAAAIINDINERFDMPIQLITTIIQSSIEAERQE